MMFFVRLPTDLPCEVGAPRMPDRLKGMTGDWVKRKVSNAPIWRFAGVNGANWKQCRYKSAIMTVKSRRILRNRAKTTGKYSRVTATACTISGFRDNKGPGAATPGPGSCSSSVPPSHNSQPGGWHSRRPRSSSAGPSPHCAEFSHDTHKSTVCFASRTACDTRPHPSPVPADIHDHVLRQRVHPEALDTIAPARDGD